MLAEEAVAGAEEAERAVEAAAQEAVGPAEAALVGAAAAEEAAAEEGRKTPSPR